MARICIIEDDVELVELMVDAFAPSGYEIDKAHSGDKGLELLRAAPYDAVILDWELPGLNGIEVCQAFRESGGHSAILFLTGKGEIEDKERGLDTGADDYLTKPFRMRELILRIEALLRRPKLVQQTVLQIGSVVIERTKRLVLCGEETLALSPKEFALLEFLMTHAGQTFSVVELMDRVWHSEDESSPENVRTHIMRIRAALDGKHGAPEIRTVHRVGYCLHPHQSQA